MARRPRAVKELAAAIVAGCVFIHGDHEIIHVVVDEGHIQLYLDPTGLGRDIQMPIKDFHHLAQGHPVCSAGKFRPLRVPHINHPVAGEVAHAGSVPVVGNAFNALVADIDIWLHEDALGITVAIIWVYGNPVVVRAVTYGHTRVDGEVSGFRGR